MPQITLIVPGSVVSKKNSRIACMIGGRNCPRRPMILPSKAYSKWEKEARKEAWLVWPKGFLLVDCPIHVEAHFYYKGNKPDLSGACESIADCLEGIFWVNDGLIDSWDGSRLHWDKVNPRTELIVRWDDKMADTCREADELF